MIAFDGPAFALPIILNSFLSFNGKTIAAQPTEIGMQTMTKILAYRKFGKFEFSAFQILLKTVTLDTDEIICNG